MLSKFQVINCSHINKLDICIMKDCYLFCVGKLAPDHIKSTHGVDGSDSKLCHSKFSPAVCGGLGFQPISTI